MFNLNIDKETYGALLKSYQEQRPLECLDHDLVQVPQSKNRPVKVLDPVATSKSSAHTSKGSTSHQQTSTQKKTPSAPESVSTQGPKKSNSLQSTKKPKFFTSASGQKQLIADTNATKQNSYSDSDEFVPETEDFDDSEEDLRSILRRSKSKSQPSTPRKSFELDNITKTPRTSVKITHTSSSGSEKSPNESRAKAASNSNSERLMNSKNVTALQREPPARLSLPQEMDVDKFVKLHIIKNKVLSLMQPASSSMQAKLQEISFDIEDIAASYLPDVNHSVGDAQCDQAVRSSGVSKRLRFNSADQAQEEDELFTPRKKQKVRDEGDEGDDVDDNDDKEYDKASTLKTPAIMKRVCLRRTRVSN
ncbi:hypothetical protein GGU10DRAFT_385662 [Lentinula aff. detonsa]|uniref:Uncharacterized protein n=1 Tax=Lentinula aff. detonsa TaxID=2804958 RepID=A0AA38L0A5_9AGAR|nr:hypothetical protein GGU10DRAFT_385662 [Lentinula aff. detonsa]